mgnify:CR=1 FL=1
MTETYVVYWIRLERHKDPLTEGYVGITKNRGKRMREHRRSAETGSQHVIHRAMRKYAGSLKVKTLFKGSRDDCKAEELRLRPDANIGWNICAGGVLPPPQSLEKMQAHWEKTLKDLPPHRHSNKHKEAVRERNHRFLYTIWNKHKTQKWVNVRLWEWCEENGVRQSCMQRVALGQRKHHRGYCCSRVAIDCK